MEDVDLCLRLHEAGPSSYRSESPVGKQPLQAVPWPPPSVPGEGAAGESSSRRQKSDGGYFLSKDSSAHSSSGVSEPPSLRQRRQPAVAASAVVGTAQLNPSSSASASAGQPRSSRPAGWFAGLQTWAASHCRRRGRVRQLWWPVAHTSGRRLEAWGNLKATKIHFTLGLAWYCDFVTPTQLVSLYHSMYTDDYR